MKKRYVFPALIILLFVMTAFFSCGNENDSSEISITFDKNSYTSDKKGVLMAEGNVLSIITPGRYRLSGTLDNAQLKILCGKSDEVELILDGVSITNEASAPLYIESADKVYIELAEGSVNTLTDTEFYVFPENTDKPNACLYSSEDLTISGSGTLIVNAAYNNGIGCKNDLKIKNGSITVTAPNNALKGNDSVSIEGGTLILSGSDGIKSDSTGEDEGYVNIEGGNISISAADDGIQSESAISIKEGASVSIDADDDALNCTNENGIDIAEGALTVK